jgi:hypothetical protein
MCQISRRLARLDTLLNQGQRGIAFFRGDVRPQVMFGKLKWQMQGMADQHQGLVENVVGAMSEGQARLVEAAGPPAQQITDGFQFRVTHHSKNIPTPMAASMR